MDNSAESTPIPMARNELVPIWTETIPTELYHASASVFHRFDFERSSGCVWFTTSHQEARSMAKSFARAGRGDCRPMVYMCRLRPVKTARFDSEDAIFDFSRRYGWGLGRTTAYHKVMETLRSAGYDALVDLRNGEGSVRSYAALLPDILEIVWYDTIG